MKVSYNWLQDYIKETLPKPSELVEGLTMHSYEVESIEEVGDDYIFDIDILPNRASDSLSHIDIAREIVAVFELNLKPSPEKISAEESKIFELSIEDEKDCLRYSALIIRGIKSGQSPEWLKERLIAIGQKPINVIVDITNYVMFAVGQPLHAFDLDKLEEKDGKRGLEIRRAKNKEKITLLSGEELELDNNSLVIADSNANSGEVLGIAGIKGGIRAEIDEGTKNIVIESANFNKTLTRKSARNLKIQTDASKRFENGITPKLTLIALNEASKLFKDLTGGEIEGMVDIFPKKSLPYKVGVSLGEVNQVLGITLSESDMENVLNRLSFEYKKVKPRETVAEEAKKLIGVPYKYGASILNDAPEYFDCSSFTGYLFVQAGVAIPRVAIDQYVFGEEIKEKEVKPGDIIFSTNGNNSEKEHKFKMHSDGREVTHIGPKKETFEFSPGTKVEGGVSHCGLYIGNGEVIHASRDGGVVIEKLDENKYFENIVGYRSMLQNDNDRYVVTVPYERLDLRIKEDLIEEIGRIYGLEKIEATVPSKLDKKPEIDKTFYYTNKIRQTLTGLGFSEIMTSSFSEDGEIAIENPLAKDKEYLRKELKSEMNNNLESNYHRKEVLGIDEIKIFEIGKAFSKELGERTHLVMAVKNQSENFENLDKAIEVLSNVLNYSIKRVGNKNYVEVNDLDVIIEKLDKPKEYDIQFDYSHKQFKNFSQYPFVLRDIAVFLSEGNTEEDLLEIIKKNTSTLLVNSRLVDVYEKKNDDGSIKTSYAYRLVFQSRDKTLSDSEVNEIMDKITKEIAKKSDWKVR